MNLFSLIISNFVEKYKIMENFPSYYEHNIILSANTNDFREIKKKLCANITAKPR